MALNENIEDKKKTDPPEREDPVKLENEARKAFEERMAAIKKENEELLAKVEKRNAEFKEMAAEMKMSGKSAAGNPGPSEEEKAKAAAMKLVEGTGFEQRLRI